MLVMPMMRVAIRRLLARAVRFVIPAVMRVIMIVRMAMITRMAVIMRMVVIVAMVVITRMVMVMRIVAKAVSHDRFLPRFQIDDFGVGLASASAMSTHQAASISSMDLTFSSSP
jgi:hypothetical protein